MNIEYRHSSQNCCEDVLTSVIPVGTVFKGKIGLVDSIFLKTYDSVVNLKNPENTWDRHPICVRFYKPLKATLLIEK